MTDPTELEAALRANLALIVEAQRLLTDYRSKRTQAPALIDNLLLLLDGRSNARRKSLRTRRSHGNTFQRKVKD
jgi:hypothetical protein